MIWHDVTDTQALVGKTIESLTITELQETMTVGANDRWVFEFTDGTKLWLESGSGQYGYSCIVAATTVGEANL